MKMAHPVTDLFAERTDREIAKLAQDITRNGQQEPIWLHMDRTIIDGRARWAACEIAGVEPVVKIFDQSDAAMIKFVVINNLKTRPNLTRNQRSMLGGRMSNATRGQWIARIGVPRDRLPIVTQAQAAGLIGISTPAVNRASYILANGIPELVDAVEQGHLSLSGACDLAHTPPDVQREGVRHALAKTAATRRLRKASTGTNLNERRRITQSPITKRYTAAIDELHKSIARITALSKERQFNRNTDQLATKNRSELTRAINALTQARERLPAPTTEHNNPPPAGKRVGERPSERE